MKVAGIDPGLLCSHGAVITTSSEAPTAYGVRAALCRVVSGTPCQLAAQLFDAGVDVVLVEVARGAIRSQIDHDPVLEQNVRAGEIIGHCRQLGLGVVPVASGGAATAWSWRVALGVRHGVNGVAAKDAAVTRIVRLRLTNSDDIPCGPRGGHIQHYHDAAGLALAGLDRILARPELSPEDAISRPSTLESARLMQRKDSKSVRKQARKTGLYDGHRKTSARTAKRF